jgi:SpoVK/Ycf46/Vps4 family AAA+-type ATPase
VPDPLLASLAAAVAAAPDDLPLRLHYGQLLLAAGQAVEALTEAATVIRADPANAVARDLMSAASAALTGSAAPHDTSEPKPAEPASVQSEPTVQQEPAEPEISATPVPERTGSELFDWSEAEKAFEGVVPQMFVGEDPDDPNAAASGDVEQAGVRLADVAGMKDVKERLENAFLLPMRNPELRRLYGKSLRGGLLLYGPPGCGKTFIARAVAGELGARFYPVSLVDVLDMYIGESERKLRAIFDTARENSPCVLFLDEVDAIGHKRTDLRGSGLRSVVQSLLSELDGADNKNDGVFVLAATNHPWDVDSALRRPGRFDRMLLVLPPDEPARQAVLRLHLRARPVETVDLKAVARRTEGYSGADLAHVCETAAEHAMADSVRSGKVRGIRQSDLLHALSEIRPSTGPWLEVARNVAQFGNESGTYDDLLAYLKKRRLV